MVIEGIPTQLPPLIEAALYPLGRGIPAPLPSGRAYPIDDLLPVRGSESYKGTHINHEAAAYWESNAAALLSDRNRRGSKLEPLRRRKKKHTARARGQLADDQVEERRWLRRDFTKRELEFFSWLARIAQVRTNEIGVWNGHGVNLLRREEIAERIDSHFRQDSEGRWRCWQTDRLIAAGVAAGYLVRIDQRKKDDSTGAFKSRVSIFKVTNQFWADAGVLVARDKLLEQEHTERQLGRGEPGPVDQGQRFRVAKFRSKLAKTLTADYGPNGPPPPTRGKPPG